MRRWRFMIRCNIFDLMSRRFASAWRRALALCCWQSGAHEKRFALPHSTILIHQPLGGVQGQATDIEIHAREILRIKSVLNDILVHHTGQPKERIE